MFWMMIGGGTLFLLIVVGVVVAMMGGGAPEERSGLVPVPGTSVIGVGEEGSAAVPVKSDVALLAEAEPKIRAFVEAVGVADLLPLVRNPEVAEARMRARYPDGVIAAPGMATFNTTRQLARRGTGFAVRIRTRDYEEREVVFFDTPEGIRIDWESWAGWSEMPWDEFVASKPGEASLFRLKLSVVEYYNFSFSDDAKWRSYRLESPDGEHSLFGYAERGTVMDSRLPPPPDVKQVAWTLRLRFPEDAASGNQVLIEEIIAEGWVLETEETP